MNNHHPVNYLLDGLPDTEYGKLLPYLELLPLMEGQVLNTPGQPQPYLYFPLACVVGLHQAQPDGSLSLVALTGNEGAVGAAQVLAADSALGQTVVLKAGAAYRIRSQTLLREFKCYTLLHRALLQYAQSLLAQIIQNLGAEQAESLAQKVCRWLMLRLDSLPPTDQAARQALIGAALGIGMGRLYRLPFDLQAPALVNFKGEHILSVNIV